jgi:hypothetical protein
MCYLLASLCNLIAICIISTKFVRLRITSLSSSINQKEYFHMELTRVDTVVQFTAGSATTWNNVNVPVPSGVVVIDTVNKIVKEGDGATLFANLPVCFDYNFNSNTSGAITPVGNDVGVLAIADDSTYSPSATKLTDLLGLISTRNTTNTTQQTSIDQLNSNVLVASVLEGTPNGTIAICNGGKYSVGTKTLTQLIADLIVQSSVAGTSMHIIDLKWYSDSGLTQPVLTQNDIIEESSYYCKVEGFHDIAEEKIIDFGLSTTQNNVVITNSAKEETCALIATIYGGANADQFSGVDIDGYGNIYCAGQTASEGAGIPSFNDAIIIKYDNNFNVLAQNRLAGNNSEGFADIVVDSNDDIICCGTTWSDPTGSCFAIVIKFDSDLNIITKKRFGSVGNVTSASAVSVDSNNNVFVAATSNGETAGGYDMHIWKFDSNLSATLAKKRFGGSADDSSYGITIDKNDNIIVVGQEYTEYTTSSLYPDAIILKFDNSLNLLFKKRYGGGSDDGFMSAITDNAGNIYAVGYTFSEGFGTYGTSIDALIVKFDPSLNILARKVYGGTGSEHFYDVKINSSGNIVCSGDVSSEGAGGVYHASLVVFDSDLTMLSQKFYHGAGTERFLSLALDSYDNMVCVGHTTSEGLASSNCLGLKVPAAIPSGSVTGATLTGLTFADLHLSTMNSALTLNVSAMSIGNSTVLTFNDVTALTLTSSALTHERDVIAAARKTAPTKLLTSVYSSTATDIYNNVAKDASNNYYAVGYTIIGGVETGLIVKYDSEFNVLARKLVTGFYSSVFNSVHIDVNGDIAACGWVRVLNGNPTAAMIAKYNKDLNTVLGQRILVHTYNAVFLDSVHVGNGNWYACGYVEDGSGIKEGYICKFGVALNLGYKKIYGGSGNDVFTGLAINSAGYLFAVGYTTSEGPNTSGFIMKLDSSGNIVLRKYYNSSLGTVTTFNAVATSDAGTSFAVGYVTVGGIRKGLVVKFDTSLNVTGSKLYGSSVGDTEFSDVKFDTDSNIVIGGKTIAEGAGSNDALIVKMTQLFVILGRKTYGTFGTDGVTGCIIDTNNDITITGSIYRNGNTDAIIAKLPSSLPVGVYAGKVFTELALSDSKLTLSDDSSTLVNSTLTWADSSVPTASNVGTLSEATGGVLSDKVILDAVGSTFRVNIGSITGANQSVAVDFSVTADDGNAVTTKTVGVNVKKSSMITALYGSSNDDYFEGADVDSEGNIYCVGNTTSEGSGGNSALIVKYDSNLNVLARKYLNGPVSEWFSAIAIDKLDNIFCVGATSSNATGAYDAYIVKFDKNLSVVIQYQVSGAAEDVFTDVCIDKTGFVVCCGYTSSEGVSPGHNAFCMRLDTNLSPSSRATYGGTNNDIFMGVTTDSDNNVYCVGYAGYTGTTPYSDSLIVKYDSNLTLVAAKLYGDSNSNDSFSGVVADSNDNIICVGWTGCEGPGSPANANSIIVKFNKDLTILARKYVGGVNWEEFYRVITDKDDNIYCVGRTTSEGPSNDNGHIIKFDKNLSTVYGKIFGGTGVELLKGIVIDIYGNVICCGRSNSEGSGVTDAMVVKFPNTIPSGTFAGTILTGLTLSDSNISAVNSNLTLANAALTVTTSTLVFVVSTLTSANSTLTSEREVRNF